MNKLHLPFYAKLAVVLLTLILLFYIAYLGKEIFAPLAFAFLFATLLLPVANAFEKMHFPRALSSLLSVILMVILVALILFLIGSQISSLSQDWPHLKSQVENSFGDLQGWINNNFHINILKQKKFINSATQNISSSSIIGNTVLSISVTVIFIIFIPVYTFFLLFYRELLLRFLVSLFAEEHAPKVYEIMGQIQHIVKKYIIGLFLEMFVIAVVLCILFEILGIKYAILLGVISAIFNIIPYVGIYTAILLCVLITSASAGASKAVAVAIAMLLVHIIDGNILMPRIVGSKVRINALITIVGVIAGSLLWGIPGMFLAIPAIAILKIIFDRVNGLQPWGILLGDDTKSKMIKIKRPDFKKLIRKKEHKSK